MKNVKKILAGVMALLMIASLAACGNTAGTTTAN